MQLAMTGGAAALQHDDAAALRTSLSKQHAVDVHLTFAAADAINCNTRALL